MTIKEKIEELTGKLIELSRKQEAFGKEIDSIRVELLALKMTEEQEEATQNIKSTKQEEPILPTPVKTTPLVKPIHEEEKKQSVPQLSTFDKSKIRTSSSSSQSLEKYIGENLISKIGILITIIGVAIGAKYSFDNGWVSPMMRIVLGYVMGLGLFGIGYRLKSKYENYSAVLVSGAMAIMYFITFIAYSVYGLIPKMAAFDVMAVFTIFTVVISMHYNRQIIALIGLVGAYAVPFFTSDGSGNIASLFAYMTIINIGILVIAFKRYWKLLYYSAFIVSWLIYLAWFNNTNDDISANVSEPALIYGAVFFMIFYAAILAYKLIQKEQYNESDLILLLVNAFIYYYIGSASLSLNPAMDGYLGLFSFGNVILHSLVGFLIYKQQLADKKLFHTVISIMLILLAITIPLQFDEIWFIPLWTVIASILFWLGRSRKDAFYERFSYIYIFLAFFGMIVHWVFWNDVFWSDISAEDLTQPILNTNFLITLLFIVGMVFINWLHRQSSYTRPLAHKVRLSSFMSFMLPSILLVSVYYLFRFEINYLFDNLLFASRVEILDSDTSGYSYALDERLEIFRNVWILNYSLIFLIFLAWFNLKKIKSQRLGFFNLGLNLIGVMLFLTQGLTYFYELQELFTHKVAGSFTNISIRYLSYAFLIGILYRSYQYNFVSFMQLFERKVLDIIVHFVTIIILSFELVSWMEFFATSNSTKLGLSILWSIYAVGLVVVGIWRQHAYLRFAAIAILGVTLLKLFFYDIAHLDTISKTIVFVVIGLLLLLVSYLYNRYKDMIVSDN